MDDNRKSTHSRTIPIRHRTVEGPSTSTLDSSGSNIEGTFIPLSPSNGAHCQVIDFFNPKFVQEEDEPEEDIISIINPQTEEKPPILLLFPDLQDEAENRKLAVTTSTSEVTQLLVGKKPDFSLLKPSKKLNPVKCKLSPVVETSQEQHASQNNDLGNEKKG